LEDDMIKGRRSFFLFLSKMKKEVKKNGQEVSPMPDRFTRVESHGGIQVFREDALQDPSEASNEVYNTNRRIKNSFDLYTIQMYKSLYLLLETGVTSKTFVLDINNFKYLNINYLMLKIRTFDYSVKTGA
jgi:hypothetical protein